MPFRITPSDQIVIDDSHAGPDDLLRIELADGTWLYVERVPRRSVWRFTPELLPEVLAEALDHQAGQLLHAVVTGSWSSLDQLKEWHDEQLEPDLRTAVCLGLSECGICLPGEDPNIGRVLSGKISDVPRGFPHVGYVLTEWEFDSPIARVVPVTRWEGVVEVASRR